MKSPIRITALALLAALLTPAALAQSPGFKLENRSSFSSNRVTRDPFWPIGWSKKGATTAIATAAVKADDFSVTTIMIDQGTPLAVINGKVYGEGETMTVDARGNKVQVQVAAIEDGRVVLRHQGESLSVPLRRK